MYETAQEVGRRLLAAKPPRLSYPKLHDWLLAEYGVDFSDEQLRKYHRGQGPEPHRMDIEVMVALAETYSVELRELSVIVEERFARLSAMAAGTPPGTRTQNLQIMGSFEMLSLFDDPLFIDLTDPLIEFNGLESVGSCTPGVTDAMLHPSGVMTGGQQAA